MTFTEFRRALALDAVGPALLARAEWLPRGARQAVADAVLAAVEPELQQLQAQLANVARLADEYPAGIDTALIHAALDGQDPS
ncbi:hypothetical protein ACFWDI_28190 [Streptomyces sp. NPDC060064]|uniref:hypothetical protein n=1 Tax=Streptomyces sp. NPDC060064 TaxID=3347049 RepID=UPI003682F183